MQFFLFMKSFKYFFPLFVHYIYGIWVVELLGHFSQQEAIP